MNADRHLDNFTSEPLVLGCCVVMCTTSFWGFYDVYNQFMVSFFSQI